jgi:hypothetical protein
MSVSQNEINEFVKEHLKLLGIDAAVSAGVMKTAALLGGGLFWREPWYFKERHKEITLTASTCEYGTQDKLEAGVDGIIGIRVLTSSDYGFNMIEETPETFDKLFPYPTSETTTKPTRYKLFFKNGYLYFSIFPPPDSGYTVDVTYTLGWELSRLNLIPDNFADVYMEAVLLYALPMKYRSYQQQVYRIALQDALAINSPSRKRVGQMRTPGYVSPQSEMEIALEIGGEFDDD